jgi:hypothetical protein
MGEYSKAFGPGVEKRRRAGGKPDVFGVQNVTNTKNLPA